MEKLPQLPETASTPPAWYQAIGAKIAHVASTVAILCAVEGCEHASHLKMRSEADAFNALLNDMGYEAVPVHYTNFDECQELALHKAGNDEPLGYLMPVKGEKGGYRFTLSQNGEVYACPDREAVRRVLSMEFAAAAQEQE